MVSQDPLELDAEALAIMQDNTHITELAIRGMLAECEDDSPFRPLVQKLAATFHQAVSDFHPVLHMLEEKIDLQYVTEEELPF